VDDQVRQALAHERVVVQPEVADHLDHPGHQPTAAAPAAAGRGSWV
jgi:hypothetical protein